jgi:hypothetical protein
MCRPLNTLPFAAASAAAASYKERQTFQDLIIISV